MSDGPLPPAQAIRLQLERILGPVSFTDLRPHFDRDAVFIVDVSLSLLDCGVGVATDDVALVKGWIDDGRLRKPTREERARFESSGGTWNALVVQPFVLIQTAVS